MLAHGFDSDMFADLVRARLANRYHVTVQGGGRTIRVTYVRIGGRRAEGDRRVKAISVVTAHGSIPPTCAVQQVRGRAGGSRS